MYPIKTILETPNKYPGPPILIIDETTIRCTHDAGPICQCPEKYEAIQNYIPFLPGGVNPYKRTQVPDADCFEVFWRNLKVGSRDWVMEEPFVIPLKDLPKTYVRKEEEDLMYLRNPQYSPYYLQEKLKHCTKDHVLESNNC